MEFHAGDKIVVIKDYGNHNIVNKIGIIRYIDTERYNMVICGVAFNENICGHRLDHNECEEGYGWNIPPSHLRLANVNRRIMKE